LCCGPPTARRRRAVVHSPGTAHLPGTPPSSASCRRCTCARSPRVQGGRAGRQTAATTGAAASAGARPYSELVVEAAGQPRSFVDNSSLPPYGIQLVSTRRSGRLWAQVAVAAPRAARSSRTAAARGCGTSYHGPATSGSRGRRPRAGGESGVVPSFVEPSPGTSRVLRAARQRSDPESGTVSNPLCPSRLSPP
jgi:hypothetical protein